MSYYRVWEYPNSAVPYKHVFIKRDRIEEGREKALKNTAAILEALNADEKLQESLSRSKRNITDLILCNPFEYFCTFTFNADKVDRYNYDTCQKKLRKFFNNFKSRYAPDFKYLIIPEFHKDGAIHFHGVCSGFSDGELKENSFGYLDWERYRKSFGFFNCSKIRNYNACAFYVSKYVTKDLVSVGKGRAVYMCSVGLNRPKLIYDEDNIPVLFKPEFENEYCAVVYDRVGFNDDEGLSISLNCLEDFEFPIDDNLSDCNFESLTGEQLVLAAFEKTDWWELHERDY